jgi:hypothetical protein
MRPYLMTKGFTVCKTLQLCGGGGGGVALTRWQVGFTIYVVSTREMDECFHLVP